MRASDAASAPGGFLPCSYGQEALWLLEQTRDIGSANNLPVAFEIRGRINKANLEEALAALVDRHAALRTEFSASDGRLVRVERERSELGPIKVEDLPCEGQVTDLLADLCRAPVDLMRWPQFRTALISHSPEHHVLLLVFHHCVFDGTSMDIAVRDLIALYGSAVSGTPTHLPAMTADYSRYVADEQERIRVHAAKARSYWEPILATAEDSLRLPAPVHAAIEAGGRSETIEFQVDCDLRRRLRDTARRCGASLFTTLLAAVQIVQYRYAGGGEEGVATAIALGTRPSDLAEAIGMFANEAPLHSVPADELTIGELVEQVQRRADALFELRLYPFTEAAAQFGRPAALRDAVQAGVTYIRSKPPAVSAPGIDVVSHRLLPSYGARRPLMLWFFDDASRVDVRVDFDPTMLLQEVAAGLVRHLETVLVAIADRSEDRLGELELLAPEERAQILTGWNDTFVDYGPDRTVSELVEAQVEQTPEATALIFGDERMSYHDLNTRANRLAHHLRRFDVGPNVPVAICAGRSFELVVGLLAILKAGGAYVPLDPEYPRKRLEVMLAETAAPVVLTQEKFLARLPAGEAVAVCLDRDWSVIEREPATNPLQPAGSDNLAYIIYTSGSTGTPKGVAMPHRSLHNLLEWQRRAFAHAGSVRTLQFASVSFDVAFQDIFSTLATGGSLVLVDEDARRDPDKLAILVEDAEIQRLFVPPLVLNLLAQRLLDRPRLAFSLEIITAGEALEITPAIRNLWLERPDWTLENQYGPTESHVATFCRLGHDAAQWPRHPSIGRPIANDQIYILDRNSQPVPIGVAGQLYIGGKGVARGYLNRPQLTAERFIPNPFDPTGSSLYKTGDLARWGGDGTIEFLGRVDQQVKIRGYRIEPGEIQETLARHPEISEAAVVACRDDRGEQRLVAYVVGVPETPPTSGELRSFLRETLPEFMIPAAFVALDALPQTPNGKLAWRDLPPPGLPAERDDRYTPPSTEIEETLTAVWADVLRLDRVGTSHDFFELGGHSLLAAQTLARVNDYFELELPIRTLFDKPTVAQLATTIEEAIVSDIRSLANSP